MLLRRIGLWLSLAWPVAAQVITLSSQTAAISASDVRNIAVPAGSASTLATFTLDPVSGGHDIFDVVISDPGMVVSLLLPNGIEVTSANAAGLGFSYTTYQIGDPGILSAGFFGGTGNHVLIQLGPAQPPGTYSVKANASTLTADAAMSVFYSGSSSLRTGVIPDSFSYRTGDTAVLSGLVFDGINPISGAAMQANVWRDSPVTSGLAITNYVQTSQTAVDANTNQYTYQVSLVNSGAALNAVNATATSTRSGLTMLAGTVAFGDVQSGSTTATSNSVVFQLGATQTFDPTQLTWTFQASDQYSTVPLLDNGTGQDASTGDGIYTGAVSLALPGTYNVAVLATGTSAAGLPFSRTAVASFSVMSSLGDFVPNSVVDSPVGNPVTAVTPATNVDIQVAGEYIFSLDLVGSNGQVVQGSTTFNLGAGSDQQVSTTFQAAQLVPLGNGPWEREYVRLILVGSSGNTVAAQINDAGPSAAYALSSFSPPSLYFTRQNSASGIDTTGSGSFDVLQVLIGISNPAGYCEWSGTLTSSTGVVLDFESGSASFPAGNNSITLNFNGNLIAQSGIGGPYLVTGVGVTCAGTDLVSTGTVFQTPAYSIGQFHNLPQSLSLTLTPSTVGANQGATSGTTVVLTSGGGFQGVATLSASGLPSGASASFFPSSQISIAGTLTLNIGTDGTVAPGSYPFTVTATSGNISTTAGGIFQVTFPDFALALVPATLTVAPSSQTNSTTTVTPLNGFSATVSLSSSGLPSGAVASFLPSTVSGSNPGTTTLNIVTNGVAPGTYPFTITGTSGTLAHTISATLVVVADALPYPWLTQGIGSRSSGGSATNANGTISVIGPGNNLNSTADSFQFTYQPWTGDGTLIGRISQLQNATGIAMAGIMIRETLDPAAQNVFLGLNAGSTVSLQSRVGAGNSYIQTAGPAENAPYWFELVRSSNTFTAYTSPDGLHWTQVGSTLTITMATSVYAGLALSSDASGSATIANFDDVLMTASADFYLSDAQPLSRTVAPNSPSGTYALTVVALNGFNGTVSLNALGLPTGAAAVFSAPSIAGSGGTVMTISAASVGAGTYPFYVAATNGTVTRFAPLTLVVSAGNISGAPDPWSSQDIGTAAAGTGTTFSNGAYAISGSGQQLTGTTDGFRFEYQSLVGDGTIIARVVSVQNKLAQSSFGVMMRDGLDPGALYAAMLISNNSGDQLDLLARTATDTAPSSASGASVTEPYWVELVRAGNTFTGYASPDGINWTQVGATQTIAMNAVVLVGLAVSSGDPTQITTVNFDNLNISSGADFYLVSSSASLTVPPGAGVYYDTIKMLALSGSFGSANLTVNGVPSGVTATLSATSISAGEFSNLQISVGAAAVPGIYPIAVTGTAGSLVHSVIVTLTITPTGTPLPSPWAATDIGPILPGVSTFNADGTMTIQGSGAALNGTPDTFRYTYQQLTGDGTIIVHVNSLTNIWAGGSAGVMIRESLLPDAAYAYSEIQIDELLGIFLDWYGGFQYRPTEGTAITQTETSIGINPYWVELTRSGNVFSGFISPDGVTWTQIGSSVTINMAPTVFLGLVADAGNSNGLAVAGFDSLFSVQGPDFATQVTPAGETVPTGRGTAYYTSAVFPFNSFSNTVTWSISGLPSGATATFNPPTATPSAPSILEIVTSAAVPAGTYAIQVTGTSGSFVHSANMTLIVDGTQTPPAAPWQFDFVGSGMPTVPFGVTSNSGGGSQARQGSSRFSPLGSPGDPGSFTFVGGAATDTSPDAGVYLHQTLSGDGTAVARITNITNDTTGAAVMIRQGIAPGAPFALLRFFCPNTSYYCNGPAHYSFETRSAANGSAAILLSGTAYTPTNDTEWLKLTRQGTQITAYVSPDGSQWERLYPSLTLSLIGDVEIGILSNGGATVDNVSVSTTPEYLVSVYPSFAYSMNGTSASFRLLAFPSLDSGTGAPTFTISGLPSGVTASFAPRILDFSASSADLTLNAATLTVSAASTVPQGTYPLTITASNGSVSSSTTINLNVMPGFNLEWLQVSLNTVHETPTGFYGYPNIAAGLGYSDGFSFNVNFVGGYSTPVYFGLQSDLGYQASLVDGSASTTISDGFIIDGDGTEQTNGQHSIWLSAVPTDSSPRQDIIVPVELGPDFTICCGSGFTSEVTAGGSTTTSLSVGTYDNDTDNISLSVSGAPTGLAFMFSNNPLTTSVPSTNMTVTAAASAPSGSYYPTLTASSASVTHNIIWNYPLNVEGYTFSVAPTSESMAPTASTTLTGTLTMNNGFSSSVTFAATGLPSGVTATFSPTSRTTSGTTTITLKTSSASVGTYTIQFTATSGSGSSQVVQTASVTLTVAGNFSISATSATTITAGGTATNTITVTPSSGFSSPVALSVSGLPSGVSGTFSTNPVPNGSGTSTLTLTATAAAVGGSATVTVTGTSGSLINTATFTLTVKTFSLSASPSTLTLSAGATTGNTYTLTMTVAGGYNSTVTFGTSTLPTGVTASFSPTSLSAAGTSTLTITTTTSASPGTYSFNITGTSGSLVQTVSEGLTITAGFSLSNSGNVAVTAGGTNGTATITLTATSGLSGATSLSASGLPTNATASFNPTSVTGSGTSTLTFVTPSTVAGGTYAITVTGTNGTIARTTTLTVTVKNFSFAVLPTSVSMSPSATTTLTGTLTMTGGFASTVAFGATGLPSGATATFSPTSLSASGSTTITVKTSSTAAGTYTIQFTATSGSDVQSSPVTLTVAPDFSISATSSTTITAGGTATNAITITPTTGFSSAVSLSVSGLPSGVTGTFSTNPVPNGSGTSTLNLTATSAAAGGNATVTVTGTSGSLVHTTTFTLTVKTFSLSTSPGSLTLAAGATSGNTYTVTLAVAGGFNSAVTFGTSGLPTGVTASFSPTSLSAAGTSTLTITAIGSVTPGTYSFNITGTSGSLVQTISAGLTLTAGFTVSNSGNVTVTAGGTNGTATITLTATSGLSGATSLSASGLPTNATAGFSPTSLMGSGTSTLTFVTPSTVAGGTYTITVTGTNGSLTRTTTLTLTVGNFSLSISPTSLTVTHGSSSKTATVTLTVAGGFSSTVTFSATGQQSGVTITFNPTSRSSNGTTTMTVSASSSATRNTSTVTVKGTSGSLVQSVPLALTVN